MPSTTPQRVDTRLTRAAIFLVVTVNPGLEPRSTVLNFCADLPALLRAVGFRGSLEGSHFVFVMAIRLRWMEIGPCLECHARRTLQSVVDEDVGGNQGHVGDIRSSATSSSCTLTRSAPLSRTSPAAPSATRATERIRTSCKSRTSRPARIRGDAEAARRTVIGEAHNKLEPVHIAESERSSA